MDRLEEAWEPARAAGAIGPDSIEQLRAHAQGFVLDTWRAGRMRFVDVGTGAGVPGVLLAEALPRSRWVLVDAAERRCRFARQAVAALELDARVDVVHGPIDDFARQPDHRGAFQGATARSFGVPAELAECALPLLAVGGQLVISVNAPAEQYWRAVDLESHTGCRVAQAWTTAAGRYLAVVRTGAAPVALPRRTAARRRAPLF